MYWAQWAGLSHEEATDLDLHIQILHVHGFMIIAFLENLAKYRDTFSKVELQ